MKEQALHNDFAHSGFFALRTPLLPFDEILAFSNGLEAISAGDANAPLETALTNDRSRLRARLMAVLARPEVREALFLASPTLSEHCDQWLKGRHTDEEEKIQRALLRYFLRMAGRATPFGLFAGCTVGTMGSETRLQLADRACYRRHTRLDMDYLVALTEELARQPEVRSKLNFCVNNSLHSVQGRLKYLEVRRKANELTHHHVVMQSSSYLDATLGRATQGATPESLATAMLKDDPEATSEDAQPYIDELIDSQVLVSELRPTVTGPEPTRGLADCLRQRGLSAATQLDRVSQELEAIDSSGLGTDPARYRDVARVLEALPRKTDLARLFQVDMSTTVAHASLGPAVVDEIMRGVVLLHRLARRPREDHLSRFREAFVGRYESREVPLVEALDTETGVGFGGATAGDMDSSSLLEGLNFPKATDEQIPWCPRDAFLLRKLTEALASSASEIVLDQHDLEQIAEKDAPPLPGAFAVMAVLAAESQAALARGEFCVLLSGAAGPPGSRLLGRLCHADPQLHRFVQQHIQAEEATERDAIFVEIVHLPEGRLGNVLARPVLRDYEIPYLGRAGVPPERQIAVTDLMVSVDGERIVLRSARLGRRVVPRLSSAHNFNNSQGIYQFLCALQSQGTAGELGWD